MLVKADRRSIPSLPANLLIDLLDGGNERLTKITIGHEVKFLEAQFLSHEPIGDCFELAWKMVRVPSIGTVVAGMFEVDPDRIILAVNERVCLKRLAIFGEARAGWPENTFHAAVLGSVMRRKADAEIDPIRIENPQLRAAVGCL